MVLGEKRERRRDAAWKYKMGESKMVVVAPGCIRAWFYKEV
jgi:hypothetical protein